MRYIPIMESEPMADLPTTTYERGKWYERRGYFEEALQSFREAAHSAMAENGHAEWTDQDRIWLEYGQLSMRMRSYRDAEDAFRTVISLSGPCAQEAMNHWAALLLAQGMADHRIHELLAREAAGSPQPDAMLGRALHYIGAYSLAASSFSKLVRLDPDLWHKYVSSLMATQRFSEALRLLNRCSPEPKRTEAERFPARLTTNQMFRMLCEWRLGRSGPPELRLPEAIALADTAVSVGMVQEAEELLAGRGDHAYYALISLLYQEGYTTLATEKIQSLVELPLYDSGLYAADVVFAAAESMYDRGSYEEAATLFEFLRTHRSGYAGARFGEAACYLHTALKSLAGRLERNYASAEVRKEIELYLSKIHAALHVVESTRWHTEWSPAQKRNDRSSAQSSGPMLN